MTGREQTRRDAERIDPFAVRPGLREILRAAVERNRREGTVLEWIQVDDLDALLIALEHTEARLAKVPALVEALNRVLNTDDADAWVDARAALATWEKE